MFLNRKVTDIIKKSKKSILLLGPRQTGKSTLIKNLEPELSINLAHEATFLDFASDASLLEARIHKVKPKTVFIDEVQRLPSLLNTIQSILDDKPHKYRFFLTGSSARKLRRGKANLLPGRLISLELGPLTLSELGGHFDLSTSLSFGTLPGIYFEENKEERERTLQSYAATYLKEEIQAEALTKDLEGFARFLRYCAATSGSYLDMTKLSREAQVKRASAIRFFEILEDTLLVSRCDAFAKGERRRLVQHPRYFFFDNGVLNGVLGNFQLSEDRRGPLFEHFVYTQIWHSATALGSSVRMSNYRTEHHAELDIILEFSDGNVWAIECKAGLNVGKENLRGFSSFQDFYKKPHKKMVIYGGKTGKQLSDVLVLPVDEALAVLFNK